MEEDKFENLFKDFRPELTPDAQFMARLQHALDAVELVKQENRSLRRQTRKAIAVATLTGFATGILFSQLAPALTAWIAAIPLPAGLPLSGTEHLSPQLLAWMLSATASVVTALCAYEIVLTKHSVGAASSPKGR